LGGVTSRIEKAIKALEEGKLKEALYLTDKEKLAGHHAWIEKAARTCLANRNNKKACAEAIKEAQEKLRATITAPLDDTSLEGIEEYLGDKEPVSEKKVKEQVQVQEKSDEELYESCEECHVAEAVAKAADICEVYPQTVCSLIEQRIGNEDVQPEEWIKTLKQAVDQAEGPAKAEMAIILGELTDYLRRRNSPLLKALREE
jgi:hypothetical protein